MNTEKLISAAFAAREMAYAPYSSFKVGAALLCTDGRVFTGCNVESVSHTPTCCAERTAFFKAISEGARDFSAIAIVGGADGSSNFGVCPPCGVCRQVMSEFCGEDFEIILVDSQKNSRSYTLKELLPLGFSL